VFNDDGTGVRGNLRAVVRAILLDYEARSTALLPSQSYGHLREPVLRVAHSIRALHGASTNGWWLMNSTDSQLNQTPLKAPTVFNFFEPDYSQAGEIAEAGMFSPEFQIANETTVIQAINFFRDGVYNSKGFNNDVYFNLTTEKNLATSPTTLVDSLNRVLMAGLMSSGMQTNIINFVATLPGTTDTDKLNRAKAAVYLVLTSPEFATEK
jgi:uncharacterized protein (DUF1800 family)